MNTSVAGQLSRTICPLKLSACRCFSDGHADKSTHFGFETVPEGEKAQRGEDCPLRPLLVSLADKEIDVYLYIHCTLYLYSSIYSIICIVH